jgi:multiple sugar transport system permease protein
MKMETTMVSDRTRTRRPNARRIAFYILCIVLAVMFVFPIVWSILNSLKPALEASASPPTLLPSRITFENYAKLNKVGVGLGQYVFNSAGVALLTALGAIVVGTLAGYGFSRFEFPGKNAIFVIILASMMIPFQSILTPLFLMLGRLKLQNNLFGLALVYIMFQLPFSVFIMRNTFAAVPREIEEAALMDGCTPFSLLYRIMLVLVRPGIITVAIYTFLNAWNEFLAALIIMSREERFTLPILLTSVRSGLYGAVDWGALQAGIAVSMIPCLIIFLLLQRYYMQGLMGGSVKG